MSGLVYLLVLMLAVLNPLACLIHCAVMDLRADHGFVNSASIGTTRYVCDMGFTSTTAPLISSAPGLQLPTPAPTTIPRAVYEGVLLLSLLMTPLWLCLAYLKRDSSLLRELYHPPQTPPPRRA